MNPARVREIYNSCDPAEALDVEDPRNVDLDNLGVDPRGAQWATRMARDFELSNAHVCKLFSGLPGSGKSTELRRLLHQLNQKQFLPVHIDAEKELDLASPVDAVDIVAVVVYAVEKAVLEQEKKDPKDAFVSGYGRRLWDFLTRTDVTFAELVASEQPIKVTTTLKTNPTVRQRFREILAPRLTQFLAEARDYVDELQQRAGALGRTGIVVAFDSLEKLRGPTDAWDAVFDSAERVFGRVQNMCDFRYTRSIRYRPHFSHGRWMSSSCRP